MVDGMALECVEWGVERACVCVNVGMVFISMCSG